MNDMGAAGRLTLFGHEIRRRRRERMARIPDPQRWPPGRGGSLRFPEKGPTSRGASARGCRGSQVRDTPDAARGGAALALALGYAGYLGVQSWLYRAGLDRAMSDLSRGDYAAAAPQFAAMARRRPGAAEVEYRLGECERARGRHDAALAAWSRVPPGSARGLDAALARGRLAMELGRFTEAERALTAALAANPAGPKAVERPSAPDSPVRAARAVRRGPGPPPAAVA